MNFGSCQDCGIEVKKKGAKRCRKCLNKYKRDNPKIGRHVNKRGYVFISCPGHPRAAKNGNYVAEHILVMEKKIGRYLDPKKDVVHHINRIKSDNRPENLFLTTATEHGKLHATKEVCKMCGGKYRAQGYCEKHYSRWKKAGFPQTGCPRDPDPPQVCRVCGGKNMSKGLCRNHWRQWRKSQGLPYS